jgi:hypothetical protein
METRSFLGGVARAVVVIAIVIGVIALAGAAYGLGVNATLNPQTVVQAGQPVVVAPYPYWHGGFGFFGIFVWIIGFFLIIGLLRAAFGRGRGPGRGWGGGRGKWGHYEGRSFGPGGPGFGGPEDRIAEWHRELHRREAGGTGSGTDSGTDASARTPGGPS